MDDFGFELTLGRAAVSDGFPERGYVSSIAGAAARAGTQWRNPTRIFTGARIGRGAVAARLLSIDRTDLTFRRAIVRTRTVRMRGAAMAAARRHLDYILRDGVASDGSRGHLYCADNDDADGRPFIDPWADDRHHFRIVVSAEDGARYEDLKPLVRRFMSSMEEDLGTGLNWVAANHVDTLYPHTHIMLRGRDDHGADLVIAPDYVRQGMGERVARLVSLDLGPPSAAEVQQQRHLDVHAERLTSIDLELLGRMDGDHVVIPGGRDMAEHAIRTGRLRKLGSLGLAEKLDGNRWRLAEDLEQMLGRFGSQEDAMHSMERSLESAGFERARSELVVHNRGAAVQVTGRLVGQGLSGETTDRHYVVIDGLDGRCHHVDIGRTELPKHLTVGAIVRVEQRSAGAPDIEILSAVPLDKLVNHQGETWLDRELAAPGELIRDGRFGREFGAALAGRRSWLIERQLATMAPNRIADARSDYAASVPRLIGGEGECALLPWKSEPRRDIGDSAPHIENGVVPGRLRGPEI